MTVILSAAGPAPLSPPPSPAPARPAAGPVSPGVPTSAAAGRDATAAPGRGSVPSARSGGQVGPVLVLPGASPSAVVPVARDGRPVGAFVLAGGRVRYRALVDPDRMLAVAAGALAVGLITAAVAVVGGRRRPPAIGTVRMGPGGWVSLRGVRAPALRPDAPRPWWARALRARRLVVAP